MPNKQVVDEKLDSLTQEERQQILEAVLKTKGKMFPDGNSLIYLYDLFKQIVEPNFNGRCGKCRKRVVSYWYQRLENWKMI
jgi:hypothetical protein